MPPWMKIALANVNTREVPGSGNNPKIIAWAKAIGGWIASFYTKDEIPWCGLFVGFCLKSSGFPVKQDLLSALSWAKYGVRVNPTLGAILVFKRPGGGHVGFYNGEDANFFYVLGGNQTDNVTPDSKIDKSRLVDCRWPEEYPLPKTGKLLRADNGKPVSRNEA